MSYATPTQVKSLFRDFPDNSEAAVTDAELQDFLDDAQATIDARISEFYSLPITNADALKILKRLSTYKVACMVDSILNSYSKDEERPMWCKMAKDLMNAIAPEKDPRSCRQCEPTMKLPGENYIGTKTQRNTIKISSTAEPTFRKGEDNW